jgi:putative ABC transport system permease protein
MLKHLLVTALARIGRAPFTTGANVLTLALGLACFIAALGIGAYWRSADSQHAASPRTFVVGQSNSPVGQPDIALHAMSTWTLARFLREDFPEVEFAARASKDPDVPLSAGQNKVLLDGAIADADFLRIFDLDFVAGDRRTALSQPNSVVLTQDAATRLFGAAPALGKPVLINGRETATVTGVIAPVRQPSFMGAGPDAALKFDFLRDWASSPAGVKLDNLASWTGIDPFTFVALRPGASVDAFNAKLPAFIERRASAAERQAARIVMHAFPVAELTTFDLDRSLFGASGLNASAIAALLGLGALTLLIACVNYANLATAQATGRSKEVGMRRVLGAGGPQIMAQAWFEAVLLTFIAGAVALVALLLASPAVRAATSVDVTYFLTQGWRPWALLAGLLLAAGLVAGAYPALILSRVRPASALRSGKSRGGSRLVAKTLVALQFASASFLLVLVTVTQLQRVHLEQTILAPKKDPVVVLNNLLTIGVDYDTLATRLNGRPGIRSVSVVDLPPWARGFNGVRLARSADPGANAPIASARSIGYDYFETFSIPLLAGRAFDRARDTSPQTVLAFRVASTPQVVVDRHLAESLGFASPEAAVGATIYIPPGFGRRAAQPVAIIGVTETETTTLSADSGAGQIYSYMPKPIWGQQRPVIRLDHARVSEGVASINQAFGELAPGVPADIRFFDQMFEQSYRQYTRIGQLFVGLACAAFAIASIGLLGIAVYVASRRRHEIAVRKTLGSTVLGVMRLLLTDFSIPVLIGNLLAWPVSWLAARTYLNGFSERIELTPAPFVLCLAVTLLIAWAAIIGVVLKAATLRPAEVLRHA